MDADYFKVNQLELIVTDAPGCDIKTFSISRAVTSILKQFDLIY